MCGIAGWIDWEVDVSRQERVLRAMIERLGHRGPDAHGIWLSPRAALAHHRLSVIDPAGGTQPMLYRAGEHTYAISYNGELYNFRELRAELEILGHSFQTRSDTEVLLRAYIEWGEECSKHLNGIFAFGLWDGRKQQLFLVRDHLGVKPLYYAQRGSAILFSSEIKAILEHPAIEAEVDAEGLAEVLHFGPVHTPGFTIYCDIHEVRAGEQLVFTAEHKRVSRFWSLQSAPHTDDLETTTEKIRALLADTVKRQLIADVPVVAMLSGGLDSSGLVALAAREFQREQKQLHTYAIDFAESEKYFSSSIMQTSRDGPWAQRVAEHTGTQHHTIIVNSGDLLENLLIPVYAHDMPALGQMETSLYLLCKAMKQDATVALSGESADEVFGGYAWFYSEVSRNSKEFPWHILFDRRITENSASFWWSEELMEHVQPLAYSDRRYQEALREVPWLEGEDTFHAKIREIFFMNLTRFLPVLLSRKDRMSMATGFEVRVPYCDYRLVEYAWNIPWEMKNTGDLEKGILRRALTDVLPEDARNRKKSPYPLSLDPQYKRGLSDWLLQITNDPNAPVRPFLNQPAVRALIEGNLPGVPGALTVTPMEQIIQVNAWLQKYHIRIR